MPATDRDGMPDGCFLCDGRAGSLHHISYEPEKVVLVCSTCHQRIHKGHDYNGDKLHPDLLPDLARPDWEEEHLGVGYVPPIDDDEITWNDEDIGVVNRDITGVASK